MNSIIDIRHLTKRYGKLTALDNVTLSVSEGSVFGLIGPDGAGKTTLYQILTTLLNPDEGSAAVAGLDVVRDYRKLRTEIGYMPERFSLYPDLTVSENLHFFASLFGVDVKDNFDLIAPIFNQLKKIPRPQGWSLVWRNEAETGSELRIDTSSQSASFRRTYHWCGRRIAKRVLGHVGNFEEKRHHHPRVHLLYGRGGAV